MITYFMLLSCLFIKHFYVDFINQTDKEVIGKGIFLNLHGLSHSFKHGAYSFIILFLFTLEPLFCFYLSMVDFLLHYIIDYVKVNLNRMYDLSPSDKYFWVLIGLDQLLHQFTYIFIAYQVYKGL